MNTQTFSPSDYKKWLYYSANFTHQSQKEEFFKCIETESNSENFRIQKLSGENDQAVYTVQCDFAREDLCLVGEEMRSEFLDYFKKNYLDIHPQPNFSNVPEDTGNAFLLNHSHINSDGKYREINPHRKEKRYYHFSLFMSALVYTTLMGTIAYFLLSETIIGYLILAYVAGIGFFIFMASRLVQGLLVGHLKGNAVKVTDEQYPEIFEIVLEQAQKLNMKKVPEIYIYYGPFNAFVTKMSGRHYLVLLSEVVETALKGDREVLRFVIGHEMGHIKRKHLSKTILLLPSRFVPFLPLAYSRACEYTCDRIGYSFSSGGAVNGILTMASGKALYKKIDPQRFIDNALEEKSFWVWFSEKFSTHPHLAKRLKAIKEYNKFR